MSQQRRGSGFQTSRPVAGKQTHSHPATCRDSTKTVDACDASSKEETHSCGPKSPLQWLLGERANIANRKLFQYRERDPVTDPPGARKSAAQLRACTLLHGTDSEDEDFDHKSTSFGTQNITVSSISTPLGARATRCPGPSSFAPLGLDSPISTPSISSLRINTQVSCPGNSDQISVRVPQGEARVIAPNVSKLSPFSAVEVRLESAHETVAVLCSVDVLKMRSGFFHDILSDQDRQLLNGGSNSLSAGTNAMQGSMLWREPVTIPERAPFEAAAFLESLHEGRATIRADWNFCWARLSVSWCIDDLIQDYGQQITNHFNKLMSLVCQHHWRVNAAVLSDMRIAVFRKGTASIPTVVTGWVSDSQNGIGYSKIRVHFDNERSLAKGCANSIASFATLSSENSSSGSAIPLVSAKTDQFMVSRFSIHDREGSVTDLHTPLRRSASVFSVHSSQSLASVASISSVSAPASPLLTGKEVVRDKQATQSLPITGDVGEPFWVQSTKDGSAWTDPDDLFLQESKKWISSADKQIFWEMARALIEMPEFSNSCKSTVRNEGDLLLLLKKPEYRVLWTTDGPPILPKDMAAEFVRFAFVGPSASVTCSPMGSL